MPARAVPSREMPVVLALIGHQVGNILGAEKTSLDPILADGLLQTSLAADHRQPLEVGEVALIAGEFSQRLVKLSQRLSQFQ